MELKRPRALMARGLLRCFPHSPTPAVEKQTGDGLRAGRPLSVCVAYEGVRARGAVPCPHLDDTPGGGGKQ